jgi:ABC-type transporter Mla subunit MlaD
MSDYNTSQRRLNMIVGSFVIVGFAAFLWMIFIFGELPIAVTELRSFRVVVSFPEAPGIQQNTPIYYCGYQVGRVVSVMAPEPVKNRKQGEPHHEVKVTLAIQNTYKTIPSNVEIVVVKRSMGSSYIDLQVDENRPLEPIDPANSATAYLYDGIPIRKGVTGMNSEFFPKETRLKMEELMDSITQLAKNANDVVGDPETKVSLKSAVANVRDATEQAKDTLASIRKLSDKGTVAVEDIAANVSVSLRDLQQVLVRAREGNGTAARLLNDGRLYENLLDSSQELQSALEQLKYLAADAREKGIKLKW